MFQVSVTMVVLVAVSAGSSHAHLNTNVKLDVTTCGDSTNSNVTYFVNPGYSGTDTGIGACTLTVNHVHSDICQIRLDFVEFNVDQPDMDSICVTDFFTVFPSDNLPVICGMYVATNPADGPMKVTVDRSFASSDRMWNIEVTQIPCDSLNLAPTGCLQYYTETSGTVSSFNFDSSGPTLDTRTRQIANMDYGVCIEMADGYCGIIWERNTIGGNNGFTMSGNAVTVPPDIIGTPDAGGAGPTNCITDYVIIPGSVDDTGIQNDRYCGLGFPNSVTWRRSYRPLALRLPLTAPSHQSPLSRAISSHRCSGRPTSSATSKPFTIFVKTDGAELVAPPGLSDINNSGFNLNYRQFTTC